MIYWIFTIWSVQITVTEEIIVKMPLKKRSHTHITVIQVLVVLRYLCLRVRALTRTFWSAHEHYNFFFVFRVCKKFMIQKEWLKIFNMKATAFKELWGNGNVFSFPSEISIEFRDIPCVSWRVKRQKTKQKCHEKCIL